MEVQVVDVGELTRHWWMILVRGIVSILFAGLTWLAPGLSLTARLSAALSQPGKEASFGLAVRHGPFRLFAERRVAIDSAGRNDWSLTAASGFDHLALPAKFRLDGYAQAGVVGGDGFADGALHVERDIARLGNVRLAAGGGAWAATQPGARHVDIGPQIVARIPAATRVLRFAAEWRARVGGDAAPGSGPAISLAADF